MFDFINFDKETNMLLGQEFLTWLWYKSEYNDGIFYSNTENFYVRIEPCLVVRSGEGKQSETASVSGAFSPMNEARFGLSKGKKVIRALISFAKDTMNWQVSIKAEDFSLNSFKTPPFTKSENELDEDANFFMKLQFITQGLEFFDEIYKQFLEVRLFEERWQEEIKKMQSWIFAK